LEGVEIVRESDTFSFGGGYGNTKATDRMFGKKQSLL
jgi:hypothetical protein